VHFELDAREHIVVRAGCLVGRGFAKCLKCGDVE